MSLITVDPYACLASFQKARRPSTFHSLFAQTPLRQQKYFTPHAVKKLNFKGVHP